jgi:hypothetical protein
MLTSEIFHRNAADRVGISQYFVLMPQARMRHQPRTASKIAKTPAAINATPAQTTHCQAIAPAMIEVAPNTARTIRPRLLMLRLKKCFTGQT